MKALTDTVYIDSDQYCFILYEKGINKKEGSANFGKERFEIIGYYSTYQQVSKKIAELGIKKYIDDDWLQCVEFVSEAHTNFLKHVKELLNKRYANVN